MARLQTTTGSPWDMVLAVRVDGEGDVVDVDVEDVVEGERVGVLTVWDEADVTRNREELVSLSERETHALPASLSSACNPLGSSTLSHFCSQQFSFNLSQTTLAFASSKRQKMGQKNRELLRK